MRPEWDTYYLGIAEAISKRGECSRRQVGALLVRPGNSIAGGGYNGTAAGSPLSCLRGDCPRASSSVSPGSSYDTGAGECIAIHAEMNAIALSTESVAGMTMYLTTAPCDGCKKLIMAARIARVVWPDGQWHPLGPPELTILGDH